MPSITFRARRQLAAGLLLATLPAAYAVASTACPGLPPSTGLEWQQRGNAQVLICSAIDADGVEAFGLSIAADSAFRPRRANREERGVVAGQDVRWYRTEDGAQPDRLIRETLLELDRDRVVHIWTRADDAQRLERSLRIVEALDFDDLQPHQAGR